MKYGLKTNYSEQIKNILLELSSVIPIYLSKASQDLSSLLENQTTCAAPSSSPFHRCSAVIELLILDNIHVCTSKLLSQQPLAQHLQEFHTRLAKSKLEHLWFSVTTKVCLLRKVAQQWETLFFISALSLIIWGLSVCDTFGLQGLLLSRDAQPPINRTATRFGKEKKNSLIKCLANSVSTGNCSYLENLDNCKFLLQGLTLQCLHRKLNTFWLCCLYPLSSLHQTFCTVTWIAVLLSSTHRQM